MELILARNIHISLCQLKALKLQKDERFTVIIK